MNYRFNIVKNATEHGPFDSGVSILLQYPALFWVAAKGGLRGELLFFQINCLFFLLLPPWTGPFAPVSPSVAPESSTFIAVNAPRYKTAVMHGEFLALAPNISANQFLITAESIVASLFWIRKSTDGKMESKHNIWCIVFNWIWSMVICILQKPDLRSAAVVPGKRHKPGSYSKNTKHI